MTILRRSRLACELASVIHGKLADDLLEERSRAYPDQRPEISLLALFSYDKLSTVAREKGWI